MALNTIEVNNIARILSSKDFSMIGIKEDAAISTEVVRRKFQHPLAQVAEVVEPAYFKTDLLGNIMPPTAIERDSLIQLTDRAESRTTDGQRPITQGNNFIENQHGDKTTDGNNSISIKREEPIVKENQTVDHDHSETTTRSSLLPLSTDREAMPTNGHQPTPASEVTEDEPNQTKGKPHNSPTIEVTYPVTTKTALQFIGVNDSNPIADNRKIYGEPDVAIAFHNPGSLFEDKELARKVNAGYGYRTGHLPAQEATTSIVLALREDEEVYQSIQSHIAEYANRLYGKNILVANPENLRTIIEQSGHSPDTSSIIAVPYFNSEEDHAWLNSLGVNLSVEGLDPRLVGYLHNKARFNEGIQEAGISELAVPDFENIPLAELPEKAYAFLKDRVIGLYEKYNMPKYRNELTGLMLRTDLGGGGYNLARLYEDPTRRANNEPYIRLLTQANEQILPSYYSDWRVALTDAQQQLQNAAGPNAEVVVSRFIDVEKKDGSPGMSIGFFGEYAISHGLNRQVQDRLLACVGTGGFEANTKRTKQLREEIEDPVAQAFTVFVDKTAQKLEIDMLTQNGYANLDIIRPGPLERKLMKKRGQKNKTYGAESNPRITNRIDAVMHTVEANGKPITPANLRRQQEIGVLAVDHIPVPAEAKTEDVREIILEIDAQLKQEDGETRVIDRMPTIPVRGVIFAGNVQKAQKRFYQEMDKYQKTMKKMRTAS